ncbi:hypothetical protein MMC22_007724 [Lobaria immixta]|nr:hypothetical protein [Lobaria immixta]
MRRSPWAAFVGGFSITFLLQYISAALLSRWSFTTSGPSTAPSPQNLKPDREKNTAGELLGARLKFGFLAATSFRHTDTPYEVKNVPHFSAQDPNYVPSRTEFLRRKVITILICYLVLDLLSLDADAETNSINFSPEKIPLFTRLGDVTGKELLMRLFATLGFGACVYIFQTGVQSIFALLDVGLGMNEVKSWRPMFGPPRDAYTLRRFWSVFWHQNNRQKVSDLVDFFLHTVFQRSKKTTTTKYLSFLLHFFLSGLLHAGTDMASGAPWQETGAIQFFCMQTVGIALEEGVQHIYHSAFQSRHPSTMLWARILGYVWVILFLAWSIPVWLYPSICRIRSGSADALLPFSIIAVFV